MITFSDEPSIQSFSKRLEIDGHFVTFYFNLFSTAEDAYYLVSVVGATRKTHFFQMKKEGASWVLVNPLLSAFWIRKAEQRLSDIILTQLLLKKKDKQS